MSKYSKGANFERALVNKIAKEKGVVFVARCAGSKCKGALKVDVIALVGTRLTLYQLKKSKSKYAKEELAFYTVPICQSVVVHRKFINSIDWFGETNGN